MLTSVQSPTLFGEVALGAERPVWPAGIKVGKPVRFLLRGGKLIVADGLALLAGQALLSTLWPSWAPPAHGDPTLLFASAYMLLAVYGGGYAPAIAGDAIKSTQRSWVALLMTVAILTSIAAMSGSGVGSALRTLGPLLTCFAFTLAVSRGGLAALLSSPWWRTHAGQTRTLVVVDGDMTMMSVSDGFVVNAQSHGLSADINDPTALARLGALADTADRMVVLCPSERRAAWISALRGANVTVELLVEEVGELAPVGAGLFDGRATLKVATEPLSLGQRVLKRMFDIAVAGSALLVLAPFLLLMAIAVKLDSQGPAFFRQPRIGRGNRPFRMHKFRSMRIEMQDLHGSQLTQGRHDNRVTRIGRFIRATSIDELPQLLDVLRGDMSIVGPRPHALGAKAGDKLYWEVDAAYWHRHAVKPGMTGLAQVRGYRGTTFVDADLQNRLNADLEYVRTWSLAGDVRIICQTVTALAGSSVF